MVDGSAAIRDHLANLAVSAGEYSDAAQATRYMMGNYSNNGTKRALNCERRPVSADGVDAVWFIPSGADTSRRGVYIHGGGWMAGSTDTHKYLIDAIAVATGRPILGLDYRLAPEHPFPAGLEDCARALAWCRANGPDGPSQAADVALLGDSAGGNLVATTTLRAISKGEALPDALVMLAPVTDVRASVPPATGLRDPVVSAEGMAATAPFYVAGKAELDDTSVLDDPLVSPVAASAEQLAKFPRTLIQAGSDEYLRDQGVALAAGLWSAGVAVHLSVWANQIHVFHLFLNDIPVADLAIGEIATFLKA
jgi:acetyl esterase/lipase